MNPCNRILIFVIMALLSFACTEKLPVEPESPQELSSLLLSSPNEGSLSVMTRNIYVGTDVDILLSVENPEEIPEKVSEAFLGILATKFPERALALAYEVAQSNPHLIGLQEVSLIRTQNPGDAIIGGTIPAKVEFLDYLEIFMGALQYYGLNYNLVGSVQNADVELPMFYPESSTGFADVRLTDYDVVLARNDVVVKKVRTGHYRSTLTIPDVGIEIPRGYVRAVVEVEGCKYEFVNTHLEPAEFGPAALKIQVSQAKELMAMLAPVKIPVVLVGDFNSAAPNGKTYQIISRRHKYVDVWTQNLLSDNPDGYTFGHDANLLNENQNFWERIDYIFVRDRKPYHKRTQLNSVKAYVTGDEVIDKTPSGLWPSDHGGVVANFQFAHRHHLAGAPNLKTSE